MTGAGRVRSWLLGLDHRLAVWAHRAALRLGFRGVVLAALATLDLIWAWSLLDADAARPVLAAPAYRVIVAFGARLDPATPLLPWAVLLGLVGGCCGVMAWMDDDRVAYSAAALIKVLWAILILAAFQHTETRVLLRAAGQWICLAVVVAACQAGLPYRRT